MNTVATLIAANTIDLDAFDDFLGSAKRGREKDTRPEVWFADFLDTLETHRAEVQAWSESEHGEDEGGPSERLVIDLLAATFEDGKPIGKNAGSIYSRFQPMVKAAKEADETLSGRLQIVKRQTTPEVAEACGFTLDKDGICAVLSYS